LFNCHCERSEAILRLGGLWDSLAALFLAVFAAKKQRRDVRKPQNSSIL
jgi:hypothetical protein